MNNEVRYLIDAFIRDVWEKWLWWCLVVLLTAIYFAFFKLESSVSLNGISQEVIYRGIIALLASLGFYVTYASVLVSALAPLKAVEAMLTIIQQHLVLPVVRWMMTRISLLKQCLQFLADKRIAPGQSYSIALLFSPTVVPYRLYPISCILLE